ncbi:MAG: c-type cytochrome domain-containing protein [Pseudomonadota bacterium]
MSLDQDKEYSRTGAFSTGPWLMWSGGVLLSLIPLVLVLLTGPNGTTENAWISFLGNFHPIAVHFPIALIFIIPIIEVIARAGRIESLKPATVFLWGFAFAGALLAPLLGWSLAASGASGPLVTEHMWSGVFVAPLCFICMLLSHVSNGHGGIKRFAYFTATFAAFVLVSFTGYRGGQITHGKNHLVASIPPPFDQWLGSESETIAKAPTPEDGYYAFVVAPILENRCVSCHGANKQKGRLRLDTFAEVMRGGTSGAVVVAGQAGSELIRRVTLPQSHDEFMPTGKSPLASEQIDALSEWILAGAPEMGAPPEKYLTISPSIGNDAPAVDPAADDGHMALDPEAVAKEREQLASTVQKFQQQYPGLIDYEARSSANLVLNALSMRQSFNDETLAELAPLFERIVQVELSNTSITDNGAAAIEKMPRLRRLSVSRTGISDVMLKHLSGHGALEVLNLYGTNVTLGGLSEIANMPKLKRVYIAATPAMDALVGNQSDVNDFEKLSQLDADVEWIGR